MIVDQRLLLQKVAWDNLIILDACRYDIFVQEWQLKNYVLPALSPASWTLEWLDKVFGKSFINAIVFSSTPYINSMCEIRLLGIRWDPRRHFRKIVNLWLTAWDNKLGTVPPEKVYLSVSAFMTIFKKRKNSETNTRKIIWFLQPHYPYLSEYFIDILSKYVGNLSYDDFIRGRFDKLMRCTILRITKDNIALIKEAYRETLSKTLIWIYKLINKLEGTTIITSDHGELLGEALIHQILSTLINLIVQSIKDLDMTYLKRRIRIIRSLIHRNNSAKCRLSERLGSQYVIYGKVFFHPSLLYSTTLRKVPFVLIK